MCAVAYDEKFEVQLGNRLLQYVLQHPESTDEVYRREKFSNTITDWLRLYSREFRLVEQDFWTELSCATDGDIVDADDVYMPVSVMLAMVADVAFKVGRMSVIEEQQAEQRKRYEEVKRLQPYMVFSANPKLVKEHEQSFLVYLQFKDDELYQVAGQILDGCTVEEVVGGTGETSEVLQSRLKKAWVQFCKQKAM